MKQKILQTIKKYNLIENGDKIVLGVSGGPDEEQRPYPLQYRYR